MWSKPYLSRITTSLIFLQQCWHTAQNSRRTLHISYARDDDVRGITFTINFDFYDVVFTYESSKTQESQYLCVTNASYFAFSKQCFVGFEVQAVLMSEPYQINYKYRRKMW